MKELSERIGENGLLGWSEEVEQLEADLAWAESKHTEAKNEVANSKSTKNKHGIMCVGYGVQQNTRLG